MQLREKVSADPNGLAREIENLVAQVPYVDESLKQDLLRSVRSATENARYYSVHIDFRGRQTWLGTPYVQ